MSNQNVFEFSIPEILQDSIEVVAVPDVVKNTVERVVGEVAQEVSIDIQNGREPVIICPLNGGIFFYITLFM